MAKKAADLSAFQVNVETPQPSAAVKESTRKVATGRQEKKLVTKGFRIRPEAATQFNILKAEIESNGNGKDRGPALIAEALNMLFEKYGKPGVA